MKISEKPKFNTRRDYEWRKLLSTKVDASNLNRYEKGFLLPIFTDMPASLRCRERVFEAIAIDGDTVEQDFAYAIAFSAIEALNGIRVLPDRRSFSRDSKVVQTLVETTNEILQAILENKF